MPALGPKRARSTPAPTLELPDIPETPPDTETTEARQAIASAINLEMLGHLREAYPDADWENLASDFDARHADLSARVAS